MNYTHKPVLLDECLKQALEMSVSPRKYLDLTLGRGGHAKVFLQNFPELNCVGVDQDIEAINETKKNFENFNLISRTKFYHCSFHNWINYSLEQNLDQDFDLILIDLGVSSPQLDDSSRGFSFYHDGPLDMRMDRSQELNAAKIINEYSEEELVSLFKTLGEVKSPSRVVKAILARREDSLFKGTLELSQLIESKEGWRKKGAHPATKYFLALRMAVNNEIEGLRQALPEIMNLLNEGGRLLVITFHSLEDRVVKYIFKESNIGFPVNKKVIKPRREEVIENPRSRSALLRVFEKGVKHEKKNKYR